MANLSAIKLPNGVTYNLKDNVSGYLVPSDIEEKVDNFHIQVGEQISGDYYSIDKTYSDIFAAALAGKDYLTCSDVDLGYPYVGIASVNNNTVIAFGISATFDNMAYLDGYLILPNDTAMRVHETAIIPTKTSQLTNDSGFITSYTDTKVKQVPLSGTNSGKNVVISHGLNSNETNSVYTSTYMTYNDYGPYLTLTNKNSSTQQTTVSHEGLHITTGSYTASINAITQTANHTIKLPDKSGTIALTSDIPTSLPASDVYSWAKASTKPTYTASEVGALASNTTYVSKITTTAGAHTAISNKSGAVSFNVPTTAAHVGIKFGYTTSGNNRAVLQDSSGNLYVTQKDDNTTYSSKAAANGGTDVSLVTTGEKYTWNSKTSNTGTVTSVAASGSGGITISGSPITTSGTISIGLNLSTAINGLGEGTSQANINDYAVVQYAGGGTTTTTYHRRKLSNLIVGKAVSDQNGLRIDTGYLKLTGGSVTGPVSFGDSVSIDEATVGDLVVNGSASFTNNLQANTINGVAVGSSPKFTDTTYSSLAAASGGTAVSLVTTGEKYRWNSKTSNTGTITSVKTTAGAHTAINVSSGAVTFNIPTKTSHLTNDSNFITLNNIESTSIPTADIIAEFDSAAHMSSTDMTTQEVSDFVNSLNVGGGDEIINLFYPVGSYYETSDTTFDPNIAWGGTWVLEAEGIVHVSAGTSYAVTHANDNAGVGAKDGGESTVTLSLDQIPSHNHGSAGPAFSWNFLAWTGSNPTGKQGGNFNLKSPGSGSALGTVYGSFSSAHTHSNNGGGHAHTNMQPYIVVNRWHRTA